LMTPAAVQHVREQRKHNKWHLLPAARQPVWHTNCTHNNITCNAISHITVSALHIHFSQLPRTTHMYPSTHSSTAAAHAALELIRSLSPIIHQVLTAPLSWPGLPSAPSYSPTDAAPAQPLTPCNDLTTDLPQPRGAWARRRGLISPGRLERARPEPQSRLP